VLKHTNKAIDKVDFAIRLSNERRRAGSSGMRARAGAARVLAQLRGNSLSSGLGRSRSEPDLVSSTRLAGAAIRVA
jgi:hypothetical protein